MKLYIAFKMYLILFYLLALILNISTEVSNPCWLSFIRGATSAICLLGIVYHVIQIVKRKE